MLGGTTQTAHYVRTTRRTCYLSRGGGSCLWLRRSTAVFVLIFFPFLVVFVVAHINRHLRSIGCTESTFFGIEVESRSAFTVFFLFLYTDGVFARELQEMSANAQIDDPTLLFHCSTREGRYNAISPQSPCRHQCFRRSRSATMLLVRTTPLVRLPLPMSAVDISRGVSGGIVQRTRGSE